MRTHRNASWASAHRARTVQSAASRKLSPASVIGWSSTTTIRGREAALRTTAPLATVARSRERLRMTKVESSLVDIPVTVNRESIYIPVDFRKGQLMSVIVARSRAAPRRRRGDRDEENVGSGHDADAWTGPDVVGGEPARFEHRPRRAPATS